MSEVCFMPLAATCRSFAASSMALAAFSVAYVPVVSGAQYKGGG